MNAPQLRSFTKPNYILVFRFLATGDVCFFAVFRSVVAFLRCFAVSSSGSVWDSSLSTACFVGAFLLDDLFNLGVTSFVISSLGIKQEDTVLRSCYWNQLFYAFQREMTAH
jgi:hypothetical protein